MAQTPEWKKKAKSLLLNYDYNVVTDMIFKEFGYCSEKKLRHIIKGMSLSSTKPKKDKKEVPLQPPKDISTLVLEDISNLRLGAKYNELKRKYSHLIVSLEESEKRFDALINIKENSNINQSISPIIQKSLSEVTPVIMLSDWHFEERVDADTINNLNEYNLEIAGERWTRCIQNSLRLVNKERSSSEINELVLWLGGDFITGYIHEELEESNYLSPTQATRFAKEKIITAIKFYLEYGKFTKITIICNYGNHGRTNKKPRVSTGYKNSYEWMMYNDIADYFIGEKRVDFIIPNGLFAYFKIYDVNCRFWHGDTIKYGGGIGGLTVPLIKAISRYNDSIKADYNFMGHYHQCWEATKDCFVNGSGIGFSPYAQRIGASPEVPQQGFKLIDRKRGPTGKFTINC